jgi:hypothetical protein
MAVKSHDFAPVAALWTAHKGNGDSVAGSSGAASRPTRSAMCRFTF